MVDLIPYVCTNCGTVKAFTVPVDVGAACLICAAVDTQQKLSVLVSRHEDDPPGVEANFQILP